MSEYPTCSEQIIMTHTWNQNLGRDTVLGLRNVVEARVVHQRRRVSHPSNPGCASHAVGWICRAGFHVVLKAEGVSYFVRDYELDEPSHQRIGEGKLARSRIQRCNLREVPVANQVENIVEDADRAVENLSAAGIVNVGTVCVLSRGGQPAYHGVTDVIWRPVRIFRRCGSVASDDCLAESCRFECRLPVLYSLPDPRDPLSRRCWIDVIHDRLDGFGDGRIRMLFLQAPAGDVRSRDGAVLRCSEVSLTHLEESDATISESRPHRLQRETNHAPVREDALGGNRPETAR